MTPDDAAKNAALPGPGGGGGHVPVLALTVQILTPALGSQVAVGLPVTVTGTAVSSTGIVPPAPPAPPGPSGVSGVSPAATATVSIMVTLDAVSVPVTVTTVGGGTWNWQATVTAGTAGSHQLSVTATAPGNTPGSASLSLTAVADTPVLTCLAPVPSGAGTITVSTLSFALQIQAATMQAAVSLVQYQLGKAAGGSWTAMTLLNSSGNDWQATITLPAVQVPAGGSSIPITIRATTAQNLTGTISLTILAVDATPPVILLLTPADGYEYQAGTTPLVTAQVTDMTAGAISSGVAAVSVQLDGQPAVAASRAAATDPSTWSATLPALTHATHQITVVATDVQGISVAIGRTVTVALASWTRIEPVPRDPTLMAGLQARIADPLWLLGRQAAFGEFAGQDAASPVSARLRARTSRLTRLRPALEPGTLTADTGPGELLAAGGGPLEMLAEAEAEPGPAGPPRPLFAAQAGLHYLRLLARAAGIGNWTGYRQGLLSAYPFPSEPSPPAGGSPPAAGPSPAAGLPPAAAASDDPLRPYAGRVPDGTRLYADLAGALRPPGPGALPGTPPLAGASAVAVTSAARDWLTWYDAVSGQELGSRETWDPSRFEYAFSVAAPGPGAETILAAAQFDTGDLDWSDFDLTASSVQPATTGQSLGAVPADLPGGDTSIVSVGLPTPVTFRGMPGRRWWDFEDAAIDFGAISAAAEDITTSLVVEFAMIYGNDHFIIPVQLAVGSVCRVDSLVVTDTFGEAIRIRPVCDADTPAGPFRLFEHTLAATASGGAAARDPLFVLFPTLGEAIGGPAIEEVHFLRDEAAEIVWAIEQTALGADGIPVDRTAAALAQFAPLTPAPADGSGLPVRSYIPRTDVEQNWFPFLLPDTATGTTMTLADVPPVAGSAAAVPLPWGRILAPFAPAPTQPPQPGVGLPQEEVTRAGLQVVRAWRYARWTDGRQLSWVARRSRPGRGPGASGLGFDLAL